MNPTAIIQLQQSLGLPATGVLDSATFDAMNNAVKTSIASNPDVVKYAGTNSPDSLLNAYMTGDWSNVTNLTGKPFTPEQQKAAVDQARVALAPAYEAQQSMDNADVTKALQQDQQGYDQFRKDETTSFRNDKNVQDQNAADSGVLFSGSRFQKLNDLRNNYQSRDAQQRAAVGSNIDTTARNYQYKYGDQAASKLSSYYTLPGASNYNANVAGGKVTPGATPSSVYNSDAYNFQGTAPVAQNASIQTRAAALLANRANKLTASGYNNKF